MDDKSNEGEPSGSGVLRELEKLRNPELDRLSPLCRINHIIKEIEGFRESELTDPVALTKRCLDLYANAAVEATKNIGSAGINAAVRLKLMCDHGIISIANANRVREELKKIELPAGLTALQIWYFSPRYFHRVLQVALAVAAFTITFFIERFIRESQNLHESASWINDFGVALLIFAFLYAQFDAMGEGIKRRINWHIFDRIQTGALENLNKLKAECKAYFDKFNEAIPRPIQP